MNDEFFEGRFVIEIILIMMKASLITCHTPFSKRKAGFHWLANSFYRKGWMVNFVTAYSAVDYLKKDYRFDILKNIKFNTPLQLEDRFNNYVAFRWWRPFNTGNGYFNDIAAPIFKRYGVWKKKSFNEFVDDSEVIVFESIYDLLYFPGIKKRNPGAKFIYRVSDDLTTFNVHPFVIKAEEDLAHQFDLVSVPNEVIYKRFKNFCDPILQPHGIPKYLFDNESVNPYSGSKKNAVFVGNMAFDHDFLRVSATEFSDVDFHIIGPIKQEVSLGNIIYHGEIPYEETIKYIKNADIGLSPRVMGSLMESNKIMQYKYCRLPIIISDINKNNQNNIFYYSSGNKESIVAAMHSALSSNAKSEPGVNVSDWDDLVEEFIR